MIKLIRHEFKLFARQIIYWVTASSIVMLSLLVYMLYQWDHARNFTNSPISPPPRFMLVTLGGVWIVFALISACFFGRNMLTKDRYFRIEEVIQSRPLSNFSFVFGKAIVLTAITCLPVYISVFLIELIAWLQGYFGASYTQSFEQLPLLKFLLFTCPVSVFLFCQTSLLLNLVCRTNLVTLGALGLLLIGSIYLLTRVSMNQYVFFEGLPLIGEIGSDMIAHKIEISDWIRYSFYGVLSGFFVVLTSALVGRIDGKRLHYWAATCALAVVLGGGTWYLWSIYHESSNKVDDWRLTINQQNEFRQLDINHLDAEIIVLPGQEIRVRTSLEVDFKEEDLEGNELILVVNPGLTVSRVSIDGVEINFRHSQGFLHLENSVEPGAHDRRSIEISYRGIPDMEFAYLDSNFDQKSLPRWSHLMSYLGTSNGVFDVNYVGLPYALAWLPMSPAQLETPYKDFFTTNLRLHIPAAWQATLPGVREAMDQPAREPGLVTYRFESTSPVSMVDLFTGPLQILKKELDGFDIELLVTADQFEHLQQLEEYHEMFLEWHSDTLERIDEDGHIFPCESFRLISVPHNLRVVEGGLFMNLVTSGPCYHLFREHELFVVDFESLLPRHLDWVNQDKSMYMNFYVRAFLTESRTGANLLNDFADNLFDHQVGIVGDEAEALQIILAYFNDLIWTHNVMDRYSISAFLPKAMGIDRSELIDVQFFHSFRYMLASHLKMYTQHIDTMMVVSNQYLEGREIQQLALDHSIEELLTPPVSAKSLEAIRLRCVTLSQKLYYALGRDRSREFRKALLARFRHQNLSLDGLYEVAASLEIPLQEIFGDWFRTNSRAMFEYSNFATFKRRTADGEIYFQTLVDVRNVGLTTGILRTTLASEIDLSIYGDAAQFSSVNLQYYVSPVIGPVVWVPSGGAVQVGIVSETQPIRMSVQNSDLELGGGAVTLTAGTARDESGEQFEPIAQFSGYSSHEWIPAPVVDGTVTVDDLDEEFSVNGRKPGGKLPEEWRRVEYSAAWGKSRHTFVYSEDEGEKHVQFATQLPEAGVWRLELHIPDLRARFSNVTGWRIPRYSDGFWKTLSGDYVISAKSPGTTFEFDLNINANDFGWISVGEIFASTEPLNVQFSPKDPSKQLFGDAIRWIKIDKE